MCLQVIVVTCNDIQALFYIERERFMCQCLACQGKPVADMTFTGTAFERHCGAGASKKWRVRVWLRFKTHVEPVYAPNRHIGVWLQSSVKVRPGQIGDPKSEFSDLRTVPAHTASAWHCEGLMALACCLAASSKSCRR